MCQPNPCLHAGVCSIVREDQYSCDCTNTGYKGTNCDVGFFDISDYPTIIPNVISQPIMISSSPPTDSITLHVTSPDLEFVPSSLVFNRNNSLVQSIRVTAQEPGYYFITYSMSGPNALEFSLPEEDVLFVDSHENSTEIPLIEESTLYFPFGCHKKHLGVCPGVNYTPIVASSTSPFVSFGPLIATEGVVALEVGNMARVPLSLRGLNLPDPSEDSFPDSCNEDDVVSYSTESLTESRALVKSFIDVVSESLPSWINIALSENVLHKTHPSDLITHFLTGVQLQDAGIGEALPLVDDMFYSLLATKNLNVTIQKDVDIFQSNPLSLAMELCGMSPSNIILQSSFEGHRGVIKDIQVVRNLKENGWTFKFDSFQFSKTNSIRRLEKQTFWDGQNFADLGYAPDGNFATALSFKKHFQNLSFADIRLQFDGTLIGNVKDINQVM